MDNPPHHLRLPLVFFIALICILLLLSGGWFYLQHKDYLHSLRQSEHTFEVDHLLIKALLKEKEFSEQALRITNTDSSSQDFSLEIKGVEDIVSVDSASFSLEPSMTKVVTVRFSAANELDGIEHQPGVYSGLLVVLGSSRQEIPLIVEIETKEVHFDANLNPVSLENQIERGEDISIEVRLFNLQSMDAQNVDMQYAVQDMRGNILFTERETVVVKTQASFFKSISLPNNLAPGMYLFSSQSTLGSSVGTSSYLFELADPAREQTFVSFCAQDNLCTGVSALLLLLVMSIVAYFYFFVGAFFYQKTSRFFSPQVALSNQEPQKGWFTRYLERRRARKELAAQHKEKERQEKLAQDRLEDQRKRKEAQDQQREEKKQQIEQERVLRTQALQKIKEEEKRKLEEKKLQQQKELEKERLKLANKKQRLELLKLIFFGRKQQGTIKAIKTTKNVIAVSKILEQASALLKQNKIDGARRLYEKSLVRYNTLSIQEKKGVYNRLTEFYRKLVEIENTIHIHESKKPAKKRTLLELVGISQLLDNRKDEKTGKQKELEVDKAESVQQQPDLQGKNKQAALKNKPEGRQKLIDDEIKRREQEKQQQEEQKQKLIRQRLDEQKQKKALLKKTQDEVKKRERRSLQLLQKYDQTYPTLTSLASSFPKADEKTKRKLAVQHEKLKHSLEFLEQQYLNNQHTLLNARTSLLKMEGGAINTLKLLFASTAVKPLHRRIPELPFAKSKHDASMPQNSKNQDISKPLTQQTSPKPEAKASPMHLVSRLSAHDLAKKSPTFKKYKKELMRAESLLASGDVTSAKQCYLKARTLYLSLEYGERTQAYQELNAVYTHLLRFK